MRKTGNGHGTSLEQFFEDIKAVVRDGQELLEAGAGTLKESARAGLEATDRTVRDRPFTTVGIAFGLGLVTGMLVSGCFSRQSASELD